MSLGRLAGMLPASTSTSPAARRSSFWNSSSSASAGMWGPWPLISVSTEALIFTLMRVSPSGRRMKSALTPRRASPASTASPVKPATKPRATLLKPSWPSTQETLMPLPPSWMSSLSVRFTAPGSKAGRRTT